jgi:hypothetical protein
MADACLEMKLASYTDDLPTDAIIALEETEHGWRGLTAQGELLNVRSRNGHKAAMPDGDVLQVQGDKAVSRRPILAVGDNRGEVSIDEYVAHFERGRAFARENRNAEALVEFDAAIRIAPTLFARFNRSLVLLALGRWREGFSEYRQCERQPPFTRPAVTEALATGFRLWDGQDIAGKRLLLLHAHGFGDTIMTLRYVPTLMAIGADVLLKVPDELRALAEQIAPVTSGLAVSADFVLPILHVLDMLSVMPASVGGHDAYLRVDPAAIERWRAQLGPGPHIGIAWLSSTVRPGDYPRDIPIERLVAALGGGDANLHSVQKHGDIDAAAVGVRVHQIGDFADCAAMMMAMDRIVSVDTAAVHLAGAIGHPHVELLLGHWASWRWLAQWYPNIKLRRQTAADDWDSALAQLDAV